MQKWSNLSDIQKGMIVGFRAKAGSISEMANFVNCSHATMVKVYHAWQNDTIKNQQHGKCGIPRDIDDSKRWLQRCLWANEHTTVEQLTAEMNQKATNRASSMTVQWTLLCIGLCSLVNAHMLTPVHFQERLEFAFQYRYWMSTEWQQVAFSDESHFMLYWTDGHWHIWYETSETKHPSFIARRIQVREREHYGLWNISWYSLGTLIIVEGTMDQHKYTSVFVYHVHPYKWIIFPQYYGIYQQDNSKCHTSISLCMCIVWRASRWVYCIALAR